MPIDNYNVFHPLRARENEVISQKWGVFCVPPPENEKLQNEKIQNYYFI